MEFSNTTTESGLVQHITTLTGLDLNAFSLKQRALFINRAYYSAVVEAWKASGDWDFDDTNQADFPIATTDLVDEQADYTIPADALKVSRLEVKDAGGIWHKLEAIDDTQVGVALDEFQKNAGLPRFYRLIRGSVVLYPKPATESVTLTAGLKIYFLREVDEFVSTDTSQEPGLPEPFHDLLSLGASFTIAAAKGLSNASSLKALHDERLAQMREFFASRHLGFKTKIRPRVESYM